VVGGATVAGVALLSRDPSCPKGDICQ